MLIEFSVGNFRSFKDPVQFSMVAAPITAQDKGLDQNNLFQSKNLTLLKSAAIYGANASGKSNLIAAFKFMKKLVLKSASANSEDPIKIEPFLLSSMSLTEPSYFEVIFQIGEIRYRYGFEATKKKVYREWLYLTKARETELFWRDEDGIKVRSGFKEGRQLEERTRDNALFLSVSDQWNGSIASDIIQWFKQVGVLSGLEHERYLGFTVRQFVNNSVMEERIRDYMRLMDLGISEIVIKEIQSLPDELKTLFRQVNDQNVPAEIRDRLEDDSQWSIPSVQLRHQRFDELDQKQSLVEFSFEEQESEGTKKAFALSGPILHTLSEGRVLLIDELDARLHPLMTRHIIKLFNSTHTNPKNAQLIFVTHDTNLLSKALFRRDQIWFCEKDKYGSTDIYSLAEYKNIRNDASYEADYIAGKYGAIPFIGEFSYLIGDKDGAA